MGTIIMLRAILNAGAAIGINCIFNSRALVEHGVIVQDHDHISTVLVSNGAEDLRLCSFISTASVIKQSVKIGSNFVVGMGLSLRYDLNSQIKFLGCRLYD
jgi:UDP-3-O-[3-hydroxymyristoyl] glucosamine N-acyltransferase